jgi:acetoin utilization protein AcuB
MLSGHLISETIPFLQGDKPVARALEEMQETGFRHLPVVQDGKYQGLIDEEELMDADEKLPLSDLHRHLMPLAVHHNDHFLQAVKIARQYDLTVVPVLTEEKVLEGSIDIATLFRQLADTCGAAETGSLIVLMLDNSDFSVGEISRLVESNDAHITQLNTWTEPVSQQFHVSLRINKQEVSDLVSTFQRHEYTVLYYFGEELYRNEIQSNYDHLMNYLNL